MECLIFHQIVTTYKLLLVCLCAIVYCNVNASAYSSSGVTRQKRRKVQEQAKKATAAKGKRKRQPIQGHNSIEVDELSRSSAMGDISFSEPEEFHIHQLTLDAVKVTYVSTRVIDFSIRICFKVIVQINIPLNV